VRRAIKFNTLDSVIALSLAFLVNAAILVLAALLFCCTVTSKPLRFEA
jgi:manganese transport protein